LIQIRHIPIAAIAIIRLFGIYHNEVLQASVRWVGHAHRLFRLHLTKSMGQAGRYGQRLTYRNRRAFDVSLVGFALRSRSKSLI
jgi:hypothetical protein